jgi:hypothetical protein
MLYFKDNYSKILNLWKKQFATSDDEIKLYLFYLAHDVIVQSSNKNKKEYIIGFGDMLVESFKDLVK